MSIDLETYSDVDIKKSGVYKYAESENFEILLFAVYYNIFMDNPLTSSKELSILLLKLLECR